MVKLWITGALLLLAAQLCMAGTIAGTVHDFTLAPFGIQKACVVCHTPHNAQTNNAPLWNHQPTTDSYPVYKSTYFPSVNFLPLSANDKLCMSCHDGTIAVDKFGGNPGGTQKISFENNMYNVISTHHLTGVVYDSNLTKVTGNGGVAIGLADPTTKVVTIGTAPNTKTGTVSQVLMSGNLLECRSCHDVHNTFSGSNNTGPIDTRDYLLKIAYSNLCSACHFNK